jgi:NADPH:quinone reductase-like Zn-dependent oxidoreductase
VRTFAICGRSIPALHSYNSSIETVSIDGVQVRCGILDTKDRAFDGELAEHAHSVLVRVRRFSCNYRDKSFVLRAAAHVPDDRFFVIGSEFVGDVVDTGAAVQRVVPGDRVIGDNTYPHVGPCHARSEPHGGIPSNNASGEYLVLHEEKVMKIPQSMSDDAAAAFSVGAQTAFSMVDKLGLEGGEHVLVTAARSNTSLFTIEALRQRAVHVYATTTSAASAERVRNRGVQEVFVVDPSGAFVDHERMASVARQIGGFNGVIDPFIDLHLLQVIPLMRNGGRYVSCGLHDQLAVRPHARSIEPNYFAALNSAIVKNVSIIGNCVGLRHHLEDALAAFERGRIDVPIDSVHHGDCAGAFLERTFESRDRFGKVVYAYQ